jgi:hypothetical protein
MNLHISKLAALFCCTLLPTIASAAPAFWDFAPTPPLGWNSWDCFGTTVTEQQTLMTLWAIGRSPLIFGGDMTRLDAATRRLLTQPGMLEVNQHSTGNRQVSRTNNLIVWRAQSTRSRDHYLALFNAQSSDDNLNSAAADYTSPVLAGDGSCQAIQVRIKNAKRLILFVQDGGDGFSNDHAAWVDPILSGPNGDINVGDLKSTSATAGWGQTRINQTCEGRPLTVKGQPVQGIGTHSPSTIIFELPDGYDTFSATGCVTRANGSVQFAVLADRGLPPVPAKTEVPVNLTTLDLPSHVRITDLWSGNDLGVHQERFSPTLPQHGAGLYRLSPTD